MKKDIETPNSDNLGGNYQFKFVPVSGVLSIPDSYKGAVHHDVVLKAGYRWFDFYCTKGTIKFIDDQDDSEHGGAHKKQLTGFTPMDRAELIARFDEMKNEKYIIDIVNNNGQRKLVGTLDEPLSFNSKLDTKTDVPERNGYVISFSGTGVKKSPTYNV